MSKIFQLVLMVLQVQDTYVVFKFFEKFKLSTLSRNLFWFNKEQKNKEESPESDIGKL